MNYFLYPKIYRAPLWQRLLITCFGIFFCFLSAMLLTTAFGGAEPLIPFGLFFLLLGLLLPIFVLSTKLVLYEDKIEQANLFSSRALYRHEILGYRRRIVKNATMIDLLPHRPEQKKITVSRLYVDDAQFIEWLNGLCNLDEIDELAAAKEIEQDVSLGATPEERSARIKSWRKMLNVATYGYFAVVILLFFLPVPKHILIICLMADPLICIGLLAYSRYFTIIEVDKASLLRKLNLQPLLMFSSVAFYPVLLGVRPGLASFPLHWQKPLVLALTGGILLTLLVINFSRGAKITLAGIFAILPPLVVYAGGVSVLLNAELDHKESASYRLTVIGKYMTTGKGAANYLDVSSSDAEYRGDTSFKVSRELYNSMQQGDHICAKIHPGAFSMAWENVVPCESNP
ncbi:hypothetical protein ACO0K7_08340 [Undibacterium sp. Ji67W]|uniref:hypothetical protein n=1 Tax=Undibacterium sp. Ji67W TaxID=3413042 RepID=UPI003BF14657